MILQDNTFKFNWSDAVVEGTVLVFDGPDCETLVYVGPMSGFRERMEPGFFVVMSKVDYEKLKVIVDKRTN